LLDTQRNELRNRRQALQVNLLQYQSTVGLIRALGGGWGTADGREHVTQVENRRTY
jgi:multidrug efflux system outer membrane protein